MPAVPYKNPNNYVKYSARLAEALNAARPEGAIWANQFDNLANRRGHIETTAEEIGSQHRRQGGRLHLLGRHRRHPGRRFDGAEGEAAGGHDRRGRPVGVRNLQLLRDGQARSAGLIHHEGIGQGRITANLEGVIVDKAYQIPDAEALDVAFRLLAEEGLCLGGSSGVNVAGAIRLARDLGPGRTIVTVLCDYGTRYQSKMFNPQFLREKELPVPPWLESTSSVPEVYQHQV